MEMLNTKQTSAALQCSRALVSYYVKVGKLPVQRERHEASGNPYNLYPADAVEKLAAERRGKKRHGLRPKGAAK